MENQQNPFNELNEQDQKAAIDAAVAAVLIGLRIPSTGKPLYDWMATEFASCHSLPRNIVQYAMRGIGRSLYKQDWTFEIQKTGHDLVTIFTPAKPKLFENDSESD